VARPAVDAVRAARDRGRYPGETGGTRAGRTAATAAAGVTAGGVPGQHGVTELDDGLPQGRNRGGYAGREHGADAGERGSEHDLMQVQVLPPVRTAFAVPESAPPNRDTGQGCAAPHGRPDAVEAVWARLHLLSGSMQRRAH
jgi:hypothetical protein